MIGDARLDDRCVGGGRRIENRANAKAQRRPRARGSCRGRQNLPIGGEFRRDFKRRGQTGFALFRIRGAPASRRDVRFNRHVNAAPAPKQSGSIRHAHFLGKQRAELVVIFGARVHNLKPIRLRDGKAALQRGVAGIAQMISQFHRRAGRGVNLRRFDGQERRVKPEFKRVKGVGGHVRQQNILRLRRQIERQIAAARHANALFA